MKKKNKNKKSNRTSSSAMGSTISNNFVKPTVIPARGTAVVGPVVAGYFASSLDLLCANLSDRIQNEYKNYALWRIIKLKAWVTPQPASSYCIFALGFTPLSQTDFKLNSPTIMSEVCDLPAFSVGNQFQQPTINISRSLLLARPTPWLFTGSTESKAVQSAGQVIILLNSQSGDAASFCTLFTEITCEFKDPIDLTNWKVQPTPLKLFNVQSIPASPSAPPFSDFEEVKELKEK